MLKERLAAFSPELGPLHTWVRESIENVAKLFPSAELALTNYWALFTQKQPDLPPSTADTQKHNSEIRHGCHTDHCSVTLPTGARIPKKVGFRMVLI